MKSRSLKRKAFTAKMMLLALCSIVVMPLTFFAGCSSDPVSPTESYFDLPFEEPGTAASGISAAKHFWQQYSGEGEISAEEGGEFSISMPGKGEFIVEANSVSENTTITAQIDFFIINGYVVGLFDFSPDGLQFRPSATLQFDANVLGENSKTVRLYWLDPAKNKWKFKGHYAADADDVVSIPIDHFSKYGVSN